MRACCYQLGPAPPLLPLPLSLSLPLRWCCAAPAAALTLCHPLLPCADAFSGPLTPEPSAPAPSSYQHHPGAGAGSSSAGSSYGGSPPRPGGGAGGSSGGAGGGPGSSGSGEGRSGERKRFGNSLGRKLRTALADFLSSR